MRLRNTAVFLITSVVAAGLFSGCASLLTSDVPAETIYWLEAPDAIFGETTADGQISIGVDVSAAPGLDTNRLLIKGPGAELNSYASARWADNTPEVFDTLIRTVLEDSGQFSRVSPGRSAARTDWNLVVELRAFFAVVTSAAIPPTIEIELRGNLDCQDASVPIRIAAQATARQMTLTSIVDGYQRAANESIDGLATLVLAGCE